MVPVQLKLLLIATSVCSNLTCILCSMVEHLPASAGHAARSCFCIVRCAACTAGCSSAAPQVLGASSCPRCRWRTSPSWQRAVSARVSHERFQGRGEGVIAGVYGRHLVEACQRVHRVDSVKENVLDLQWRETFFKFEYSLMSIKCCADGAKGLYSIHAPVTMLLSEPA